MWFMCYPHRQSFGATPVLDGERVYDSGEHRFKHCGDSDRAEVVRDGGKWIGKCPRSLTLSKAQQLLEEALPEAGEGAKDGVRALWSVWQGVVYQAFPNGDGRSWHGFPVRNRKHIPTSIQRRLRDRARESGFEKEFDQWLTG
ncbi:conserved hypothetical protein [Magnetospirillum sp. LM-5]|nr:conserved hypothetical protein [Magnetospirillum sp. LM-5]